MWNIGASIILATSDGKATTGCRRIGGKTDLVVDDECTERRSGDRAIGKTKALCDHPLAGE